MKVKVSVGSKSYHIEIGEGEGSVSTLGELKALVAEKADIDPALMKIIHRGKTITGDNGKSLFDMDFKDNDRVIVMGKASDDLGFSSLVSYEKTNLSGLQKEHRDIESDLSALERNYLDVEKSMVMVGKMEKRLSHFTECSMRHLEALDRMDIIGELTTKSQAVRNREKRKSLIDGIHTLMNGNDKHVRRLEEYKKKLLGEIVE
uniref:BAG family molecular chaperone regulator 1 n=1 Tax=Angiostrongylus cantonensis TaxID=6313 RepID=A0A158P8N5_ANGCA